MRRRRTTARRTILCALIPALAGLAAGCATDGGSPSAGRGAEPPREAPALEFRSYSFTQDEKGRPVVAGQVRVHAADRSRTRDYYVKIGDPVGRQEADGDFRTGLTVTKIDKGTRPIKTRLAGDEVTVLVESYYLAARDASGREQIFWHTEGRGVAPPARPSR